MTDYKICKLTFIDHLYQLKKQAHENAEISIDQIFTFLAGKGYAALLIILSFPFCLPIQIPGFSTPFGLILGFIGLRIAFGKHPWWPQWILEKKFNGESIEKLTDKTITAVKFLQKFLHPRLCILTLNPILHRLHGILIFFLAIILSLPLPIPFTNMLAALPIFFMGLGLLEDDGFFIIISYVFAAICFLAFLGLFLFGKAHLT